MTLICKCFYTYVSFNPFLIDNMERTTFISVTNENQEYIVKKNVTDYMWDFKLDFKFHMTACEISNYSKEKFCFWKMCWFPKLLQINIQENITMITQNVVWSLYLTKSIYIIICNWFTSLSLFIYLISTSAVSIYLFSTSAVTTYILKLKCKIKGNNGSSKFYLKPKVKNSFFS